jgi:hypothetical protein
MQSRSITTNVVSSNPVHGKVFKGRIMVFNATFNHISVISWQSVLLVEETGVPEKITDSWQSVLLVEEDISTLNKTYLYLLYCIHA